MYSELKRQVDQILDSDLIPFSGSGFEFETCSSGNAALGAMSGGEIANMDVEKSLSVHGLEETIAYLHKIEMGLLKDCRIHRVPHLPRGLPRRGAHGRRQVHRQAQRPENGRRFRPGQPPAAGHHPAACTTRGGSSPIKSPMDADPPVRRPQAGAVAGARPERIETILDVIEGRDCGACGSPDCRTLAEDVVGGTPPWTDCIWLQARQQKRLRPTRPNRSDGRQRRSDMNVKQIIGRFRAAGGRRRERPRPRGHGGAIAATCSAMSWPTPRSAASG
ncbi:MAG: hypothetical protein MZV70_18690 [Desulfobacterales bacterium]|nr:hypothetical protein [Desulfobacterales bacterium]